MDVKSKYVVVIEKLGHRDLERSTYSLLFNVHRQQVVHGLTLETRREIVKIARLDPIVLHPRASISVVARKLGLETHLSGRVGRR